MSQYDNFGQYLAWIEHAVDDALSKNDVSKLEAAALGFGNASTLPGYSLATQVAWFAKKLADKRFALSERVHEFGLDIDVDAELLDDISRKTLSTAYLSSLASLRGEADLVLAFRFLVQRLCPDKSLSLIETEILKLATDERLREFVYDALRMYSLREDISPQQLARVQELARSHFP